MIYVLYENVDTVLNLLSNEWANYRIIDSNFLKLDFNYDSIIVRQIKFYRLSFLWIFYVVYSVIYQF